MQMIMPYRRRHSSPLGFQFGSMMPRPMEKFDSSSIMKTDISQTDNSYELSIELPGFSKDDVELELKDGYVIVSAQMKSEFEEKQPEAEAQPDVQAQAKASSDDAESKGEQSTESAPQQKWVRRERFFGSCRRSFYMGEDIDEENISAKFENGLLNISVPKKAQEQEPEQKKLIAIEG